MNAQEKSLMWADKMKRIVFLQLLATLFTAVAAALFFGLGVAASFLAGGLLICLNVWLMANVFSSVEVSQKVIYRSAVFRYIGVFLVLFLMAVVGVNLLIVCIGMFVVYLTGYVLSIKGALADGKGL
ncbi:MAG: ATP synthase subunit I [Mariprofundaceae bacterium]|nr:ATP synthase subunit I [Mariprofundaceae bacterium]